MKKTTMTVMALVFLAAALPLAAQEGGPDMKAMEEAWAKAARPGEWHAFLATKTGRWNVQGRMWMQPGADPIESFSTVEAEMILGGRYLMETMKGENMGQSFEGLGITGYDNTTGVVTSTWHDSMGTATGILTGKPGRPGDPLELTGTSVDPVTGAGMAVRTVTTFVSHDESVFEYFMSMDGMPEMKVMEMTYTRASE